MAHRNRWFTYKKWWIFPWLCLTPEGTCQGPILSRRAACRVQWLYKGRGDHRVPSGGDRVPAKRKNLGNFINL